MGFGVGAIALTLAGTALAQSPPILTAADLGSGWSSGGATSHTVSHGNVSRDLFTAPAEYPPGTGVALQVAAMVTSETREGLVGQLFTAYGAQGYDFTDENVVGDRPGVVGRLSGDAATSTLYLFSVNDTVVLLVVGTTQSRAPGIDALASKLAIAQAARLN